MWGYGEDRRIIKDQSHNSAKHLGWCWLCSVLLWCLLVNMARAEPPWSVLVDKINHFNVASIVPRSFRKWCWIFIQIIVLNFSKENTQIVSQFWESLTMLISAFLCAFWLMALEKLHGNIKFWQKYSYTRFHTLTWRGFLPFWKSLTLMGLMGHGNNFPIKFWLANIWLAWLISCCCSKKRIRCSWSSSCLKKLKTSPLSSSRWPRCLVLLLLFLLHLVCIYFVHFKLHWITVYQLIFWNLMNQRIIWWLYFLPLFSLSSPCQCTNFSFFTPMFATFPACLSLLLFFLRFLFIFVTIWDSFISLFIFCIQIWGRRIAGIVCCMDSLAPFEANLWFLVIQINVNHLCHVQTMCAVSNGSTTCHLTRHRDGPPDLVEHGSNGCCLALVNKRVNEGI